jgi:serine/threonine protein kinase
MSKIVDIGTRIDQTAGVGTPLYMAPEVHREERYGWPVEVFSYGMLVYATFSGRKPYDGVGFTSSVVLAGKVMGGIRPAIPADLDPKWKDLIIECWQGDPNGRTDFERICRRFGNMDFINGLARIGFSSIEGACRQMTWAFLRK